MPDECRMSEGRPISELTIRCAAPADATAMAAGEHDVAQTPGLLNARPGEIPEAAFLDKILALQDAQRGIYLLAELDGVAVGHVLLDPLPLIGHAHICTLSIVVYPPWQARGIGRALLSRAIEWANLQERIEKIELTVRADNAHAIALYRSLGFVEEGRLLHRTKGSDGLCRDDIAMALRSAGP